MRSVKASSKQKGRTVVVRGLEVSGAGSALATDAVEFDKVYFEVVVKATGKFSVGVGPVKEDPAEELCQDWSDLPNSIAIHSSDLDVLAKDFVIGVFFDQSLGPPKLSFCVNGTPLKDPHKQVSPVQGRMYPACFVSEGAVLQFRFLEEDLAYKPPAGFQVVVPVQDML